MHTTFILDVFHREIVGWQVTNHMRESLARDALTMALAAKYRAGEDVSGLVHHSHRGVQAVFNQSSQQLIVGLSVAGLRMLRQVSSTRGCRGAGY